jgi:hypothetical protein
MLMPASIVLHISDDLHRDFSAISVGAFKTLIKERITMPSGSVEFRLAPVVESLSTLYATEWNLSNSSMLFQEMVPELIFYSCIVTDGAPIAPHFSFPRLG